MSDEDGFLSVWRDIRIDKNTSREDLYEVLKGIIEWRQAERERLAPILELKTLPWLAREYERMWDQACTDPGFMGKRFRKIR